MKRTLNAVILLQLAYDELELIEQKVTPFVQDNKKRLNNTINWLKLISESFTIEIGCDEEIMNLNAISDEIRKNIREFGLEFEQSLTIKK